MVKWLEIGTLFMDDKKKELLVNLHEGYEKTLHKLDMFSHCMLYCLLEDRIEVYVTKILEISENTGQLILKMSEIHIKHRQDKTGASEIVGTVKALGQLVDIKSYFPAEEVVLEAEEPEKRFCLNYVDHVIGVYTLYGNRAVIQLDKEVSGEMNTNIKLIRFIKKGDYIRVLWWFHRFDKDAYRRNRMCKPPYNNAPRTGIFATRSPVRPNPLGSTVVRVQQVDYDNGIIDIEGFDGFQGSKIFQIMFYQPSVDRVKGATLPSWVSHWTQWKSFDKSKKILLPPQAHEPDMIVNETNNFYCDELEVGYAIEDEYDNKEIHIHNARIHNLKNGNANEKEMVKEACRGTDMIVEPLSVEMRREKAIKLVYSRHTGPYKGDSELFSELFHKLYQWADQRNLISVDSRWFVIYHDFGNDTDEGQLRLSVCMSVDGNVAVSGDIGVFTLHEGKYAVGSFMVEPTEYIKAWHYMYAKWLPRSGYKPDDRFSFEHYPLMEEQRDKRLVEIYIPIGEM